MHRSACRRTGRTDLPTFLFVALLSSALLGPVPARAQGGSSVALARAWVEANQESLGLVEGDLADFVVSAESRSAASGVAHVYFQQRHQGIEVDAAILGVHLDGDGRVVHHTSRFVAGLTGRIDTTVPVLTAIAAAESAAGHLGLALAEALAVVEEIGGPARKVLLSSGGISQRPIAVHLVFSPVESGAVPLAWQVEIETLDSRHYWVVQVDVRSGAILAVADRVVHDRFDAPEGGRRAPQGRAAAPGRHAGAARRIPGTLPASGAGLAAAPAAVVPSGPASSRYEVFAIPSEYPNDGPREIVEDPFDPAASPFGWHDTNGAPGPEFTLTRGNNVHAYADRDNDGAPDAGSQPDGGPSLDFTGALVPLDFTQQPDQSIHAAVVNLFYWNNVLHDVLYRYGFDELAGNFQLNNYGNGGVGADAVNAEAQDAADNGTRNNANFLTLVDGNPGRMQMYLWNEPNPERDGDLSSMIIAHEYGHGLSHRLTGGPGNVGCLSNAEQMGEGWSDFLGLVLTAKASDTPLTWRGVGTWALGQDPDTGAGIRPAVYTADFAVNDYTYADLPLLVGAHDVGFLWATMLWDLQWLLVEEHGFNPDISAPWNTGGNNLALQLVVDGLKLQPCGPGFVDGRNAILQADIDLTGGANQCRIWEAFSRRGLGFSASQGSPNSTLDGTPAFDDSPNCRFVDVVAPAHGQAVCAGEDAAFDLAIGTSFTAGPPVTLSSAGQPAGTTVVFAPNPVVALPGTATMMVGDTAAAPPGAYALTVTGTDGVATESDIAYLEIQAAAPAAPALVAPADGSIDVPRAPTLSWSAAGVGSVVVEVDDDPAFGSIDRSATVSPPFTSWVVDPPLAPETFYYWRARAVNACGEGESSAAARFLTEVALCSAPGLAIPDNNPAGASDALVVALLGSIADLDVAVRASHEAPRQLILRLRHVETGTEVELMNRPGDPGPSGGSCFIDDVDVLFDDEGPADVEISCDSTPPSVDGTLRPDQALAAFDGEALAGTWTLTVIDTAAGDTGTLVEWCLLPRGAGAGGADVVATKEVAGIFTPGSGVRYTVTLFNQGSVEQFDNPGDELVDVVPAGLELFDATATSGVVTLDPISGTVRWNGAIPAGGSVVVTFDAWIDDGLAPGSVVSNQGVLGFDANGNGTNESSGVTDDPALPDPDDPTDFIVAPPILIQEIPALSPAGLALLTLALGGFGALALRRRRGEG